MTCLHFDYAGLHHRRDEQQASQEAGSRVRRPGVGHGGWRAIEDTVDGLEEAFHEAVDDYIATCAAVDREPERDFSGRVMFRVSPEVHAKAALAAQLAEKSLNQWAAEVLGRRRVTHTRHQT